MEYLIKNMQYNVRKLNLMKFNEISRYGLVDDVNS